MYYFCIQEVRDKLVRAKGQAAVEIIQGCAYRYKYFELLNSNQCKCEQDKIKNNVRVDWLNDKTITRIHFRK